MADPRRRTLAASGSSGIPIPSSAARPTGSLRQSLAPNALQQHQLPQGGGGASTSGTGGGGFSGRQSLAPSRSRGSLAFPPSGSQESQGAGGSQLFSQGHGGPPPPPAPRMEPPMTGGRNNMYSSLAGTMSVGRQGTLKSSQMQQQQPQVYAPPSERRSSTYRRQTLNAPMTFSTPGGIAVNTLQRLKVDPRENRTLETRKRYASDIVQFLTTRNFAADIKMLMTPTGAQFVSIFKFLVHELDPAVAFEVKGKTFNDLVVPTLKGLGYPFADSITKSHLQAAGSQQSWPNMLAMLHWLVFTIENVDIAFGSNSELQMPAFEMAKENQQDVLQHAWLDFVTEGYVGFLTSDDWSGDEEKEHFYARLDESRRDQLARIEGLEEDRKALEAEWAGLEADPDPLVAASENLEKLKRDEKACAEYLTQLTRRYESDKENLVKSLKDKEDQLNIRKAKIDQHEALKRRFAEQGLTESEVQNTKSEDKLLQKQIGDNHHKLSIAQNRTYTLEIDLQKRLTSASDACTVYEEKATKLGVIPTPPEEYSHVNFEQEINGAAENPAPDCTTLIKPSLIALRGKTRKEVTGLGEEVVGLEEKITRFNEAIGELKENGEGLEVELGLAERENLDLKESVNAEFATLNVELERLQSAVHSLNSTSGQALAAAAWRYDQRVLERTNVIEETNELRRTQSTALESHLESLYDYKEHMVEQVGKLLAIAEGANA